MNNFVRSLLAGALVLGAPAISLYAQAPATGDPFVKDAAAANNARKAPWENVLLIFEVYALDKQDAVDVLDTEQNGAARYRRMLEIAKAGKARCECLTALTSKSGQRAAIESTEKVPYPSKFLRAAFSNGITPPNEWESRNAGDTFEIEVVVSPDRKILDINLVPQRVYFAGFHEIKGMADESPIFQPRFSSQKLTTSVSGPMEEPLFLGTFSPPAIDGKMPSETWLAFVHPYLPGATAEELKPPAKPKVEAGNVNLEYTWYSLERTKARDILIGASTLDVPWKKLQALLKEKNAQLEHFAALKTKSGQRAVVEEVQEVHYGLGYIPENRILNGDGTNHPGQKPGAQKESPDAPENKIQKENNPERQPGFVNDLHSQNVGTTVEVEPVVSPDGLSVDLNHVVQSGIIVGNLEVGGVAAKYPPQLVFENRQVTTSQTVLMGRQSLVGTFNPPGVDGVNNRKDDGRTWLLFVRVRAE